MIKKLNDRVERTGSEEEGGRSRQTREQILQATHDCLISVGFEHLTTRRIAEAAGVNVAALHYYFGSKEALLASTVDWAIAQSEKAMRVAAENAPDAATAIAAGIQAAWERARGQSSALRYDLVVRGFRDHAAHRRALAIYDAYLTLSRGVIARHVAEGGRLRDGLTPDQMAAYLNATIDGIILRYTLTRNEEDARRSLGLILKHALHLMEIEERADESTGF